MKVYGGRDRVTVARISRALPCNPDPHGTRWPEQVNHMQRAQAGTTGGSRYPDHCFPKCCDSKKLSTPDKNTSKNKFYQRDKITFLTLSDDSII